MPTITLSNDLKAQLIGWLNREKDFLLSIDSMAERIITLRRTGTLDCIKADLDAVTKLRLTLRGPDVESEITEEEADMLIDAAELNPYNNRIQFWDTIKKAIVS